MDETNLSTVPKSRHKIIAAKGKRQVGFLSSAEKGVTTTGVFCMNAAGNFLPPMVIFKRKRMKDELKDGAPSGSVFACNDSGWIDTELFEKWIYHFITYVKPSKDHPILLILHGHATHTKNLNAILKASKSGVIMLSLPPHTTHRMQPLDISVFKPLQTYFEQEVKKWLRLNPGRGITKFQVCNLMGLAFPKVASMCNAISGFGTPGIWPFNRDAFGDHEFAAFAIRDENLVTISFSNGISCPVNTDTSQAFQLETSPNIQPAKS
ncbi:uncharacterized protein LOC136090813 [Hydra vulgaris]|uniref:Uncharacterized protein LOC136090813 n=1 Tax=Hydra vulgaris TaxID=6087 RepID=A0ABM4DHA0_HYDVU